VKFFIESRRADSSEADWAATRPPIMDPVTPQAARKIAAEKRARRVREIMARMEPQEEQTVRNQRETGPILVGRV
jgi:hypothetical protein